MNLYPEMNEKIKDILKTGEPHCLYAAARIEQLESQLLASRLNALIEFKERVEGVLPEYWEGILDDMIGKDRDACPRCGYAKSTKDTICNDCDRIIRTELNED